MRVTPAILTAVLSLTIASASGVRGAAAQEHLADFAPDVTVTISDDAPGSHPDITTTINGLTGPYVARVQVLTPAGGDIARDADVQDGSAVGWIAGFSTIPAADGRCSERYLFEVPLVEQSADVASFPAFLRELAPGTHHVRFEADVAGTPVNVIVDDVMVSGEPRLRTTTYVGDPGHPAPNCAPYRSRLILDGMSSTVPITTAPPSAGPRMYEFTLTARPDANGHSETARREVTATVQPGLAPRIDGATLQWDGVLGATSYRTSGPVEYITNCALIRRLVIRQESRQFIVSVSGDVTSVPLPELPGPEFQFALLAVNVTAYDRDAVMLASALLHHTAFDYASCWYPPGEEPVLAVDPAAGSCRGSATFHGSRFPTGVNVEITMAHYGTDAPGPHVATAPVGDDGTFAVTAPLPANACEIAANFPEHRALFFAYNADEPKGMAIFASAPYTATIPAGAGRITGAPNTGSGPGSSREAGGWWLAAAGFALTLAGLGVRRKRQRHG